MSDTSERYIPSGDVAKAIAREFVSQKIRDAMQRGNLSVSLGDMAEDGTYPLHVRAEAEEFSLSNFFDIPQIDGIAWIEDRPSQPIHVWYSFPEQEHTTAESNYAEAPPVDFWMRHGR